MGALDLVHRHAMAELEPVITRLGKPDHLDAKDPRKGSRGWEGARRMEKTLPETVRFVRGLGTDPALADLVAKSARIMHRENVRQLERLGSIPGFDPQRLLGSDGPALAAFRERNVDLITTIGETYLEDIANTLEDPAIANMHVSGIRDALEERFEVSQSRAEFWAVDQTLKINSQVTQTRYRAAGIDRYVWTTSQDERVRESHAELDGKVFTLDNPPIVEGEAASPGTQYRCRCTAYPIFDVTPDDEES